MFGFVTANIRELTKAQNARYNAVYCGICRGIRDCSGQLARLGLRYDMAFLALLLVSLYEPEETGGSHACALHPIGKKPWTDNVYIRYAADMNVALAYHKAADDWQDDKKLSSKWQQKVFGREYARIRDQYPRQCDTMEESIRQLSRLEKENCPDPDACANCFGTLMAELLVYQEDLWAPHLRQMGTALGRFIYLADAIQDYDADKKKSRYNPLLAMDTGEDRCRWDTYLVLAMGRCTEAFEKLPLVQDKDILDNILYSGVWCSFRRKKKQEDGL